jgi:hypothetical protein
MNRTLQVCAPLTGWGARGAWLTVAVAVAAVALAVGATPAATAAQCPSNPTVLPDSNHDPPYQCAEMHSSSKTKLKPWATKSWTSSPGLGYSEKTTCSWKDNKNVTIAPAYGVGSYTSTGTNWAVSNSHHFAAGILWATGHVDGEGYSSGCADGDEDGHIKNSILNRDSLALHGVPASATVGQPVTLTASLSPSDASGTVVLLQDPDDAPVPVALGALSSGTATLTWVPSATGSHKFQAAYHFDQSTQSVGDRRVSCPSTAQTCGWTAAKSSTYTVTVSAASSPAVLAAPAAGIGLGGPLAPADATMPARPAPPRFGLVTRTRTRKMPGDLSLACKARQMPMHAEALTRGPGDPRVRIDGSVFHVVGSKALRGHRVSLQLSCRRRGARLFAGPRLVLGTKGADAVKTRRRRAVIFGGPGADRLTVARRGGVAHGGLGGDRLKVKAVNGVATGGPGRDRLKATASGRTLLVGGQGADTLIGARVRTFINAVDGANRDRVICRSSANLVLADPGDDVRGPCGIVRRQARP